MNAQLKPIEARAVEAPTFDNDNLMWRSAWVHDNHQKLWDYWRSLEGEGSDADWDAFTWTQWDRQMTRKDENRSTMRQY